MEGGAIGLRGSHAARHVARVCGHGLESVTTLNPCTGVTIVLVCR